MKTQAELKRQHEAKRADLEWNNQIEMLCYDLTRLARAISGPIKRAKRQPPREPSALELRFEHQKHVRTALELRSQGRNRSS